MGGITLSGTGSAARPAFRRELPENCWLGAAFTVLIPSVRTTRSFIAAIVVAVAAGGSWWLWGWFEKVSPLPARGGLWFPVTVLNDVPHFAQNDPRWADEPLGFTPSKLGEEGCAVASAAMVLASYGADLDPGRLNAHLRGNGGYTERGWLYWEKAADYPPGLAKHAYEDDASLFLIDWNLLRGNPVIVRLRYPGGTTHFVVVVGKSGYEYLIRDPGAGYRKGLYPLSEFGSPIEALRFYEKSRGSNG